jgi:prevent-host-death family protein
MNVKATELKTRLGRYLDASIKEPVFIEKSGRQFAVLISFEEYEKVTALYSAIEDKYWGDLAVQAKKEGVFQGDAMAELLKMAEEKGVTLDSPLP